LTISDFLKRYKRNLEERIDDLSVALTSGSIQDMEQYRAMVGEIQGISFAVEELSALLKRYDEDGEDTISS